MDAVFRRREQAELPAETKDVPGVDHRPALDRPVHDVFDFAQQLHHRLQAAVIDFAVPGGQAALHVAEHSGRSHGHHADLCRAASAYPIRVKSWARCTRWQSFGLRWAEVVIEVLPGAAERLFQ